MNFHFFRSRALYPGASLFMCLYLARLIAGFQGVDFGLGLFWAAVVAVTAGKGSRLLIYPLAIPAYIHAVNSWNWHPAISALFATSPEILIGIEQYLSNAKDLRRSWSAELISIPIFILAKCLNVAWLSAGFEGIANSMGLPWALVAAAALVFRFDLPLFVGAYIHATNAWNWHPAIAVLFVMGSTICALLGARINHVMGLPHPYLFFKSFPFRIRSKAMGYPPPAPWA